VENRKKELKSKKQVCSDVSVYSPGIPEEEEKGYDGKDLQKRKVLSLE